MEGKKERFTVFLDELDAEFVKGLEGDLGSNPSQVIRNIVKNRRRKEENKVD